MKRAIMFIAVASSSLAVSAMVQAKGVPQRSSEIPPGLGKVFAKMSKGILTAVVATEGSNSRLQDLPVSP